MTLTEAGWRLVPYTDTLHRQITKPAPTREPASRFRSSALQRNHSLSLAIFSDWIAVICGRLGLGPVQLAFESLAGCERLIGDG